MVRRRHYQLIPLVVVAATSLLAGGSTAAARIQGEPVSARTASSDRGTYIADRPLCARPTRPGRMQCFAIAQVPVAKDAPGARLKRTDPGRPTGPAGGLTPADLAAAYGFDPDRPRPHQTIALVDWFDDPDAKRDLDHFDRHYGLPTETARSFRKVSQTGSSSDLPPNRAFDAAEISLDIEVARAVCHTCPILLVEADGPFDSSTASAVDTAARLGATEISNSYGEPEDAHETSGLADSYRHPGVVITASTGDDGWYGWDYSNDDSSVNGANVSQNAAAFPATLPSVVSVGGTTLALDAAGHRTGESVWNENGPQDSYGTVDEQGFGARHATGGGCSQFFPAAAFQRLDAGYGAAGCGGRRLAADVSAVGDPTTGFDVYDTYTDYHGADHDGWITVGGTSLGAPLTAALFALAGGARGAKYPAASLYVNASLHLHSRFDITASAPDSAATGNSFCGGVAPTACAASFDTDNPNDLGYGSIDCSFPLDGSAPATEPFRSPECNAVPGYDGPTGVGAPSLPRLFTSTTPTVSIRLPAAARHGHSARFHVDARELVPSASITSYRWYWGDGHSIRTSHSDARHTYPKNGSYPVNVIVGDSLGQATVHTARVRVG